MQAQIALRKITAAASHFSSQMELPNDGDHARPNGQPVGLLSNQLDGQPMPVASAIIAQNRGDSGSLGMMLLKSDEQAAKLWT